jgi:predicted enzyme related to lactoylglutathione lyase
LYELNHFGIVVKDVDASQAFYQSLFGAETIFHKPVIGGTMDIFYLQIHGGLIELLYTPDGPGPHGVTHVAFLTDDLDGDHAALVAAGYHSFVAPKVAGTGVGRLAFVADPNGTRVELIQREGAMRVPPIPHPLVTRLDHYALYAPDSAGSDDFYVRHAGMTPEAGGCDEVSRRLARGYDVLELIGQPAPAGATPFAHIALQVTSVEAALAHVAAAGYEAVPADGAGRRMGLVRDPDGVEIRLVEAALAAEAAQ